MVLYERMFLVYLRVLWTISHVSVRVFCLSHNEKITHFPIKEMTSFIIFTVIKCGFLDTWISNTHINMALHFGYKCKKKNP